MSLELDDVTRSLYAGLAEAHGRPLPRDLARRLHTISLRILYVVASYVLYSTIRQRASKLQNNMAKC